jgi:hypothetical protein
MHAEAGTMRATRLASLAGMMLLLWASGAQAQYLTGNDTGGIIPWSCETEALARETAAAHCARFDKYARITSVHRQYGDYIAFNCLWNPRMARFALPAVRVRSTCYAPVVRHTVKALY